MPRCGHSNRYTDRKAHNLALRFQKYKDMVLLFLHKAVEFYESDDKMLGTSRMEHFAH